VRLAPLGAAALCLLCAAPGAVGQEPPDLDRIEALVRDGRTEDARGALLRWWSEAYAQASRQDIQRGLWLRARLTVDPAQASLDYRRLVIEYPGGPFAGMALFRLAQASFALGDSAAARESVARLLLNYPGTPPARAAPQWLAGAGPLPPRKASAPAAEAPQPQAPTAPAAGDDRPRYAVQLGAFAAREGAETVLREATEAGFAARIVRIQGNDLYRVRVGIFDSSAEAAGVVARLRELGFPAALVRDTHREERIGR